MKLNKILVVLLGVSVLALLLLCYLYYNNDTNLKKEVVDLKSRILTLNDENARLVSDNIKYMKQANLKSFATVKELERFIKADTVDEEYKDDYASVASIELMKRAREQGYWIGISAVNSTKENMLSAMLKERQGLGNDVQWICYNVAIVGDSELFFIDPQNDAYVLKIMVMSGDFIDYTGK